MKREELLKVAKPILFNTRMVRAITEGRKTVTRRIIKPQPKYSTNDGFRWKGASYGTDLPPTIKGASYNFRCAAPYQPGDILYVRETWCKGRIEFGEEPDGREVPYISQCTGEDDYIHKECAMSWDIGMEDVIWKPSIHMPKEAARIFLRVKSVNVERLQDVQFEQVVCEGIIATFPPLAVDEFRDLWDSTIKKADIDQYGWVANPYVWVIDFERVEVKYE